jgi:anhydro-N-acetylmuramic acid kinase
MHLNAIELLQLHQHYGDFLGEMVLAFISQQNLTIPIHAIASHGHTVFHQPDKKFTFQLGHGLMLHQRTQLPVVCDFRTQDVWMGGQGAPLVPIGDKFLFSTYDACLNLGGISNISFHSPFTQAMDVCPFNIWLNHYANKKQWPYDKDGHLAKSGTLYQPLFEALNQLEYYHQPSPKSLGMEWINTHGFPLIDTYHLTPEDVLATLTAHCAYQIHQMVLSIDAQSVLVTGGGTYNQWFMDSLRAKDTTIEWHIPSKSLIEQKEALIFGFLGYLRLQNKNNVWATVTGASSDHCSGMVYGISV